VTVESRTRWGARAARLYTDAYAARYRAQDDAAGPSDAVARLSVWLHAICAGFQGPIDVLDLGCGTGRYFHALTGVRRLVGIDVSRAMLDRAAKRTAAASALSLVEGDFLTHEFGAAEFDLVYAIGVLAEHSPFDARLAARVRRWLKPGGRFAFTTVDPLSFSVPRTIGRRIGQWLLRPASAVSTGLRRGLRARLMSGGLYADHERVRDVLAEVELTVESIEPFESDVHRHVLAVARKPSDASANGRRA
jgi:SAM-dependent methyltransferase